MVQTLPVSLLLVMLSGCTYIQKLVPGHKEAQQNADELQAQQLRVMRFADEYAGRVIEVVNRFQRDSVRPEERLVAENWKLSQAQSAYTSASGPSPITNTLDLVVLATLSRLVMEDVWVSELYNERARPILEAHRQLEQRSWELLDGVLTDAQTARLHEIITSWRSEHPNVRAVAYIHFTDFAKSIGAPGPAESASKGSLFSVISIDPFSHLDPAVREITQTRQLAERSIYYAQRVPNLMDMQLERLTYQLASMPETKALLADANRVSLAGSAADQLVKTLPDIIAKERQALITQVVQELNGERATVGAVTGDLRTTLQAGTETANALHATLETLDRISERFAPKPGAPPKAEEDRPFDIREYTEMLRNLTVTVRELETLTQRTDVALPAARAIAEDATTRVNNIVDRLFWRLVLLVLITIAATFAGRFAYRAIVIRTER
jgi:hypothetical protein